MQVEVKRAQAGDIPVIEAILRDVAEWLDRGGQLSGVRRMSPGNP